MPTLIERQYPSDWLKGEHDGPLHFSRQQVTVLAGSSSDRELTSGMVLGSVAKGAATSDPDAGNTGTGVMGAVTVTAGSKAGVYTLTVIRAASNAGDFVVHDPDGNLVGYGTVAVAFAMGGLSFTLADGTPDFAVGDKIYITVAAGSGKVVQIDFTGGATGVDEAFGILLDDVTAPDGVDERGVAVVRNAVVDPVKLTWPAGATDEQKAAALAALHAAGVIARKGE